MYNNTQCLKLHVLKDMVRELTVLRAVVVTFSARAY